MNRMKEKENLSIRVLCNCRNELYSLFPFLDGAFACLPPGPAEDTLTLGTDGKSLLFCPDYLISLYAASPVRLRRGYLHILLHCLFFHPFWGNGGERRLWNLACDMAVEQIIEREHLPRLEPEENPVRSRCFQILGEKARSADQILGLLQAGAFPDPVPAMEAAFLFDDHSLWDRAGAESFDTWKQVLSYTGGRSRGMKNAGSQTGSGQEELENICKSTKNYRKYLRKFAVFREEIELDMDSFDYIYYNLGMERYGNLPLIEPLETKEGQKLSQLVIAIDTSGSCSREVVRDFLRETYAILSDRENFFRKMEVWLIQCDCLVQSAAVIRSPEQWENYARSITIAGRGGTDFTPVFRYVDELRSRGKLRELKALLYFTDGDGCYPRVRPSYETAFVFLKPNEFISAVPSWAEKLLISDR